MIHLLETDMFNTEFLDKVIKVLSWALTGATAAAILFVMIWLYYQVN